MAAALRFARARQGVQTLTLTVTQGNEAAISLYQRFGFVAFGVEPMAILTPDRLRGRSTCGGPSALTTRHRERRPFPARRGYISSSEGATRVTARHSPRTFVQRSFGDGDGACGWQACPVEIG